MLAHRLLARVVPLRRIRLARLRHDWLVGVRSIIAAPWQKRRRLVLLVAKMFRAVRDELDRAKAEHARLAQGDPVLRAVGAWRLVFPSPAFALRSPGGSRLANYMRLAATSAVMCQFVARSWRSKMLCEAPRLYASPWPAAKTLSSLERTCCVMCARLRRDRDCGGPDTVPSWPEAQTQSSLEGVDDVRTGAAEPASSQPASSQR